MDTPDFQDAPPVSATLTAYDETHLASYIRLLDAAEEGASWQEAVLIIFGVDPTQNPARSKAMYDSHLARARWMTESGYRQLLRPPSA